MNHRATRARVRLLLQSEAAMGLKQVRKGTKLIAKAVAAPTRTQLPRAAESARGVPTASTRASNSAAASPSMQNVAPPIMGLLLSPANQAPFDTAPLATSDKRQHLESMDVGQVRTCTRCGLCKTRTKTVFGEGDCDAKIFFIGEGPGENEDLSGRPFVGKAGQLLDRMIVAMGLSREQVFIANIVKCRPPNNRAPMPDETAACTPYLERQLEIVRPSAIVTLGRPSTLFMLGGNDPMKNLRGRWHKWRGISLMPTFHPAYLLRSYTPENREMVWSDLQQVMTLLGLKASPRSAPR